MTDRQITHAPGCWGWGPRHYECALSEIELMAAEWERVSAAKAEAEARAERLAEEVEALRAKTAVTMGVGTGDGKLFVHGDHESIKAAQAIVLERDALRAEVERLRADRDSWEQQASDRVAVWYAEYQRAKQLEEALRLIVEEVDDLLASHPKATTYPDGPCIEKESRSTLADARDKALAALAQEDRND